MSLHGHLSVPLGGRGVSLAGGRVWSRWLDIYRALADHCAGRSVVRVHRRVTSRRRHFAWIDELAGHACQLSH